jgi:hypothetical protein
MRALLEQTADTAVGLAGIYILGVAILGARAVAVALLKNGDLRVAFGWPAFAFRGSFASRCSSTTAEAVFSPCCYIEGGEKQEKRHTVGRMPLPSPPATSARRAPIGAPMEFGEVDTTVLDRRPQDADGEGIYLGRRPTESSSAPRCDAPPAIEHEQPSACADGVCALKSTDQQRTGTTGGEGEKGVAK